MEILVEAQDSLFYIQKIITLCNQSCCLKKVFSILLFCTHIFNIGGYHLLFGYLQQKNQRFVFHSIEKGDYSDEELVLVKVPLLLPYSTNWQEYEPYNGEIEWGGVHYNYVKRKICNDSLYLLCLPNIERTRLSNAMDSYANQVQNLPVSKQTGNDTGVQNPVLANDYDQQSSLYFVCAPFAITVKEFPRLHVSLTHTVIELPLQPPDKAIA